MLVSHIITNAVAAAGFRFHVLPDNLVNTSVVQEVLSQVWHCEILKYSQMRMSLTLCYRHNAWLQYNILANYAQHSMNNCMICKLFWNVIVTNMQNSCTVALCSPLCSVQGTENKILTFVPGESGNTIPVQHDGVVTRTPAFLLSSSCIIGIRYFPFDSQECPIYVSLWSNIASKVSSKQWNILWSAVA